jgi:hypothetical protein
MTKVTKQDVVFSIMNANATLPMDEVVALILAADGYPGKRIDERSARSYYTWAIKEGKANGIGATGRKTRSSAPKAAKAPKIKMVKVPKPKVQGDKPKVTDKTVEELEDIRKKNLARLKAVGRKYAKGQIAEARYSDEPFDADAVPNLEAELDSFKAPAFLSKDAVKALV